MRCLACNKILQTFAEDIELCNDCGAWKDKVLHGYVTLEDVEEMFEDES